MDWQSIIAGLVIAGAGAYMVRRWYQTWFGANKHGACGGCECAHKPPPRVSRPID